MNVKQLKCRVCGNSTFQIFNVNDGGVLHTDERICTRCGAHHSVDNISPEYSSAWNMFVSGLELDDDIVFMEK